MNQVQEQRSRVTTAADLHRLADLARERGLRVFEAAPHTWFCTSHSDPFRLHTVTGFSCDCAGFVHHGRCTHHALLLEHLGWLPEVEVEEQPRPCFWCDGRGKVDDGWHDHLVPCDSCNGSGRKPDHRPHGLPAVQPVATEQLVAA